MKPIILSLVFAFVAFTSRAQSQEVILLQDISKIVVGPNVELILEEGEEETLEIDRDGLYEDEINIRTTGKTLKIFLDGSRYLPKKQKYRSSDFRMTTDHYGGHHITARVTYRNIKKITIRGEEGMRSVGTLKTEKLKLRVFGENDIRFAKVNIGKLKMKSYGANTLRIKEGNTGKQVYRHKSRDHSLRKRSFSLFR
jgi:hypothetical protein